MRTTLPGPNYHLPYPIESVTIVNVENENVTSIGFRGDGSAEVGSARESMMLTGDENIVDASFTVTWRVGDVETDARALLCRIRGGEVLCPAVVEASVVRFAGRAVWSREAAAGSSEVQPCAESPAS